MTELGISSLPMLYRLDLLPPELNSFFFIQSLFTLASISYLFLIFIKEKFVLGRLYYVLSAFICIFYQIPLTLFSQQVEHSLSNPWYFALTINGAILILTAWGRITKNIRTHQSMSEFPANIASIYVTTGLIGILCIIFYFYNIPWSCTGLYAILNDPWLTLLAREFNVKLVGSSLSTYAIGANANAISPIFILLSFWIVITSAKRKNIIGIIIGTVCGFAAVISVIITGTKGLLMPSLLMLAAGSYFWTRTWINRILAISASVMFVVVAIFTFEMFKDRGASTSGSYDFASCSAKAGTCEQSQALLKSLHHVDYALGVPPYMLKQMEKRLSCLCSGKENLSCPDAALTSGNIHNLNAGISVPQRTVMNYATSILYRVFVTPLQVAVWHFMYAETENVDGFKTLPLSNKIYGESLNMPELVYQKYASVFFEGDRTATSTSPTSFLLTYSSYLGVTGFLLSMILVIGTDLFLLIISMMLERSLFPVLVGLIAILSMNFIVSDFLTVLISHGGAAGICMIIFYTILKKQRGT
ncbi:hypothetical protein P8T57_05620 [Thalassospira sp. SN3W]|uniref:hypothetical protein n=1 Tax=Thalassospira sp. SN3W TaxID=3035476 RepID=UPI00311B01E8